MKVGDESEEGLIYSDPDLSTLRKKQVDSTKKMIWRKTRHTSGYKISVLYIIDVQ